MESDAAFIRAYGVVELYAIADICLHFAFVVNPCDAECDNAVGFDHSFDYFCFLKLGVLVVYVGYAQKHFTHCLQILFLSGMLCLERCDDIVDIHIKNFF